MLRLLDEIDVLHVAGNPDVEVSSIEHDSRKVLPGALFCCLPGGTTDGHEFAADALRRGAVGIVCERAVSVPEDAHPVVVRVAPGSSRQVIGRIASAFFGHPSRQLLMAGVTGTNGKTTVAHLLGSVLPRAGIPTLVIGTLSGLRTTPEAPELQRQLATERDRGAAEKNTHAVVMEVSSHALAQHRVEGVTFDIAIFTNLSHDHLDFHKTMEAYWEAKASLFTPERAAQGIVFADDPAGERLLEAARIPLTAVRRFDAAGVDLGIGWSRFIWRGRPVEIPLTGRFNVDNALLAAEAALAMGVDTDEVAFGLTQSAPVPGRLEPVTLANEDSPFSVLVDYAHTPAGLEVVLTELGQLRPPAGRLIVVFGCGGNRDAAKRPVMGQVAAQLSDLAIVTSDNPRDEDPLRIIEEVRSGIEASPGHRAEVVIEPDRTAAIALAIERAQPGDVVLIAGKGHETTQEQGGRVIPFDDRVVAREVLACSR